MNSSQGPNLAGVIDVGSNSIKLLAAHRGPRQNIETVLHLVEETRISEGITGQPPRIDTPAIQAGAAAIARLAQECRQQCQTDPVVVATSAVRDAHNRDEFLAAVRETSGLELRVLTGREEAEMIGRGLGCDESLRDLNDFTLLDLGGGSLEYIRFEAHKAVRVESFQLGCVRLTAAFVEARDRPLASSEQEAIVSRVREELGQAGLHQPQSANSDAVLTGGTATLVKLHFGLIDRPIDVRLGEMKQLCQQVCQSSLQDRIDHLNIPAPRADIFPAALLTLTEVMDQLGLRRVHFSAYNLRYGVAHSLLYPDLHAETNPFR